MLAIFAALVIGQAAAAAPAPVTDARQLKLSPPRVLAEIDTVKVQGTPVGLAWRADATLYLRVTQGKDKVRHYQIATVPGLSVGQTDGAPQWAANYWVWKSALAAPGEPALKIDVEQHKSQQRSINTSSGSAMAGNNSSGYAGDAGGEAGLSGSEVAFAALNMTTVGVVTMRFKGQVVGVWTDEAPVPGMRYGWAPAPMGVLAYSDSTKRLALIDRDGHKAVVPGTADVILPAWSADGSRLVYLQKKSAQLYLLMAVDVK